MAFGLRSDDQSVPDHSGAEGFHRTSLSRQKQNFIYISFPCFHQMNIRDCTRLLSVHALSTAAFFGHLHGIMVQ